MTEARAYGIVQFYLDGKKVGEPIDLYHDGVILTNPPVSLGSPMLSTGEHRLTVEMLGANPQAAKGYMFGLDEVILDGSPK